MSNLASRAFHAPLSRTDELILKATLVLTSAGALVLAVFTLIPLDDRAPQLWPDAARRSAHGHRRTGIGALLLLALSQVFSRGIELREDVEGLV
ncbi:hypothetical protein M3G03_07405 [Aestuariimicrobium sp. p3-SID1156]|uniref:hypothetical protein n=1 Tax=Aestuariimicrobium sp. p3-SID1156 TaxID=2916038 RepID=UPI00223B11F0|nr:hypothetical protein [Aestuariimicrobium sp. p3-SID1156]MCT1459367.1 hypothetical protein [Aestuariimicrobium sp. p3-SID1156]